MSNEGPLKVPPISRQEPSGRDLPRRVRSFVVEWGPPLVATALVILGLELLLPADVEPAFQIVVFAFFWVPMAVLWLASGSTLISVGLWLLPALALSAAWVAGAHDGWPIAAFNIALLVISFYSPAHERWGVFVTRVATALVRLSLSGDDRAVDVAAERVRLRLWIAGRESVRSGPIRLISDLDGIRKAAEDLPTDEVRGAHLRRALLEVADAMHDHASGIAEFGGVKTALEKYLRQLHEFRSKSGLYRVMTIRRNSET